MERYRNERIAWVLFLLCLILAVVAYLPGLDGGYYFDDNHVLKNNPHIRVESLDAYSLIRAAESFAAGGRPVSMLSFALNHYYFGESTWWYKFVNLIIHCCNGLGLFLLLRQLIDRLPPAYEPAPTTSYLDFLALSAVALWLLHPINLNPVLYISQRMALLASFFMVYGLVVYVWARSAIRSTRRKAVYLPLVITFFTALAYLSKENGVLLPLYAFLIECLVLRFRSGSERDRVVIAMYALGAAALMAMLAYKFWQRPNWITGGYRFRHFDIGERVLTQFRALVYYISLIIAPSNGELSLWHDDFEISRSLFEPLTTLLSLLVLLGLLGFGIYLAGSAPLVALGIFWFFISHSLESTVFSLELVHEHRNYLGSFGILVAMLALASRFLAGRRGVLAILCLALFVGYSLVLYQRSHIWSNDFTHAEYEAKNKPGSPAAVFGLGQRYYVAAMSGVEGADELAYPLILQAAENDPYTITPELLLAVFSAHDNIEYDNAWLAAATEKLRKYPYMASSKSALQRFLACLKEQKCDLPQKDLDPLFEVALSSGNSDQMTTAAFYFTEVNIDLVRAEKGFRDSLRRNDAASWVNLISFLLHIRKEHEACEIYRGLKARIDGPGLDKLPLFMERINYFDRQLGDCDY